MKLFFWNNPYDVSYRNSFIFAIAKTEEQVKDETVRGPSYTFLRGLEPKRVQGIQITYLGKPTMVVDLPCAECH